MIRNPISRTIAFLAPFDCLNCSIEGSLLCPDCAAALPTADKRCYKCHKPAGASRLCLECQSAGGLQAIQAACRYDGVAKELVVKLKFGRAADAASEMARLITIRCQRPCDGTLVVPVPTATSRVRQRGYDQSVLLAHSLARSWDLPYRRVLLRHGQTEQLGADRSARRRQLQSAFRVSRPVAGASILLVDDVSTTGSTLEVAANALLAQGARRVEAAVFSEA